MASVQHPVLQRMGEGYSWVPPGLSPARVEAYMRQLPADRVPRLGGSHGERWVGRRASNEGSRRFNNHAEPPF